MMEMIAKALCGVCWFPGSLKCGITPGGGLKAPILALSIGDEVGAMASGIEVQVVERRRGILSNEIWVLASDLPDRVVLTKEPRCEE